LLFDLIELAADVYHIILQLCALIARKSFSSIASYKSNFVFAPKMWTDSLYVALGKIVYLLNMVNTEDPAVVLSYLRHGSSDESRASTDVKTVPGRF